jgi:hypothetical protein
MKLDQVDGALQFLRMHLRNPQGARILTDIDEWVLGLNQSLFSDQNELQIALTKANREIVLLTDTLEVSDSTQKVAEYLEEAAKIIQRTVAVNSQNFLNNSPEFLKVVAE